jgi:hypothetical protein
VYDQPPRSLLSICLLILALQTPHNTTIGSQVYVTSMYSLSHAHNRRIPNGNDQHDMCTLILGFLLVLQPEALQFSGDTSAINSSLPLQTRVRLNP